MIETMEWLMWTVGIVGGSLILLGFALICREVCRISVEKGYEIGYQKGHDDGWQDAAALLKPEVMALRNSFGHYETLRDKMLGKANPDKQERRAA